MVINEYKGFQLIIETNSIFIPKLNRTYKTIDDAQYVIDNLSQTSLISSSTNFREEDIPVRINIQGGIVVSTVEDNCYSIMLSKSNCRELINSLSLLLEE